MRVLLSQLTSAGKVAIAASPDGMFHVLWRGAAVCSAATLRAALELACGPSWKPMASMHVSTSPEDWYVGA